MFEEEAMLDLPGKSQVDKKKNSLYKNAGGNNGRGQVHRSSGEILYVLKIKAIDLLMDWILTVREREIKNDCIIFQKLWHASYFKYIITLKSKV